MSAHTRPESSGGLVEIDQRSREIFRQIVDGYLATGEPLKVEAPPEGEFLKAMALFGWPPPPSL